MVNYTKGDPLQEAYLHTMKKVPSTKFPRSKASDLLQWAQQTFFQICCTEARRRSDMEPPDPPGCCCRSICKRCICTAIFLFVMILVVFLTTRSPRFYLSGIHVSSPSDAGNLTYQLQIRNAAKLLGVNYDDLVFFVRDGTNASRNSSVTVPGFYQGFRKTAQVDGEVRGGSVVKVNGTATTVVVGVEGSFRFRPKVLWITLPKISRKGVKVEARVPVNVSSGNLTSGDWIQLFEVSAARRLRSWYGGPAVAAVMGTVTAGLLFV